MGFEQRTLILDTNKRWAGLAEEWTLGHRVFREVDVATKATLSQMSGFASESWGLVIMDEIGAAVDQIHPLQALVAWVERSLERPLLVVSALPDSRYAVDAVALGATHYAPKPYQGEQFIGVIDQTLEMYRGNQGLWVNKYELNIRQVRHEQALARYQSRALLPRQARYPSF